jgi:hypothetical protein
VETRAYLIIAIQVPMKKQRYRTSRKAVATCRRERRARGGSRVFMKKTGGARSTALIAATMRQVLRKPATLAVRCGL